MNDWQLKELLKQNKVLDNKIRFYLKNKTIAEQDIVVSEIKGHIEKAEHNLNFVKDTIQDGYSDWAIVGCYYSIYHMALALILKKGYYSKNHDATLCILIKEYCNKGLSEMDIELLNQAYLNNEDILFYVNSKQEREKASYSTQIVFNKDDVNNIRNKTLLFVRKAQEILNKA